MLKILGLFAIMAAISAIVYKVFFGLRKKHIGSGNIFYVCTDGQFNESLESNKLHQENLSIVTVKQNEEVAIYDAILTHEFTNKDYSFAHKVLVGGMPIGYLSHEVAQALKQEKDELGIHAGVIYSKVRIIKDKAGKIQSVAIDLPSVEALAKVLSNRSFEHSLEKFEKYKLKHKI